MKRICLGLVCCVLLYACRVCAQEDPSPLLGNLIEGLPVNLADTETVPMGTFQTWGYARFEEQDDGNLKVATPGISVGTGENWEVNLEAPFNWGRAVPHDGLTSVSPAVLYRFLPETDSRPSFAFQEKIIFNTNNQNNKGADLKFYLIATKTLSEKDDPARQRAHFNGYWYYNSSSRDYQRRNILGALVGYDIILNKNLLFVADYTLEQQMNKEKESQIVELGFRQEIGNSWLLAYGGGIGFRAESPDYRLTAGAQYSF